MRLIAILSMLFAGSVLATPLPEPSASRLPRWRGFNLLEKFCFNGTRQPFLEEDFRMIADFGFNFVRLPVDYRGYISGGDWEKFDEASLSQIDQAVAWGGKYGIHVCINLHRAPGWTVAQPPEAKDLWTDSEAQRVAALHWGMFARRFRGIPNTRLSFNLFNEPSIKDGAAYAGVVRKMLDAIREQDAERLVLCDGMAWGAVPVDELIPLGVGQMTRGYTPFQLTHFGASWVGDNSRWQTPRWPATAGTNGALLSPHKGAQAHHPLIIEGAFEANSLLRITLVTLSSKATLSICDPTGEIHRQEWTAGPDKGPWARAELDPKWNIWRSSGAVDVRVKLPRGTPRIEIRTVDGDWLEIGSIGVTRPGDGNEASVVLENRWDSIPEPMIYQPESAALGIIRDKEWLRKETVIPWLNLQSKGVGVMIGEWGAFHKTPHEITLKWAADCLANWKECGWGWALWNFRGPFGILDSDRDDVRYEDYQGHKLDRRFLELLQRN